MMWQRISRFIPILGVIVLAGAWMTLSLTGQTGGSAPYIPSVEKGDWPTYTGQINGSRYSPQSQINAENFNKLEVAWRFKTDNLGTKPEFKLEGTPLVVRGILYTTGGNRRDVIALKADTGELIWVHAEFEGVRAVNAPRQLSGRGLAYWTDGRDERILYVTTGYKLIELDAKTGNRISTFGKDGYVDLKVGLFTGTGKQIDLDTGEAGLHSTPLILGDRVIVGVAMKEGMTIATHDNTKGQARAFDVKTGKLIWAFNTIPRKGEFGYDTWENNSADSSGNTGVWTQITADTELGLVYLPVETPTSDFYGGHRPGNDLFAESIVAVDAKTGARKWYFQMIHHGIWDHDSSSAPLLADVTIEGKPRKIVAVPSKQGWLYMFDRASGEPIWPIPEKPMPPSDVPGEKASPTQPIPSKPPAYARTFISRDDVIDFTPELRQEGLKNLEHYRWIESPYVPYIVGNDRELGALNIGNTNGGTNWPGASFDPETGIFYSYASNSSVTIGSLRTPPQGFTTDVRYVSGREGTTFTLEVAAGTGSAADAPAATLPAAAPPAGGRGAPLPQFSQYNLNVQGLSIVRPPYGVLSAIDMNKGDLLWSVPHGDTPDNVRNHPVVGPILADYLNKRGLPKAGQNGSVGNIVTKTLVVLGDPVVTTTAEHPRGAMLRAYDKKTGREVGAVFMPAPQSGSPMTYTVNGRQYIVVAVSGGNYSGEYIAYRLPASELPNAGAK
jgi:quinoprotein glucose dehydrogenase